MSDTKKLKHQLLILFAAMIIVAAILGISSNYVYADGEATTLPEPKDGVITLTEDVTLADTAVITEDTTLDLNGFTLNGYKGSNGGRAIRVDSGKLTVTDSSEGQNGSIVLPENSGGMAVIVNGASLDMKAGTISVSGQDAAGVRVQGGGTAEMNGGAINADGLSAIGASVMDFETSTFTINNGSINVKGQGSMGIYLAGESQKAIVNGGTITVEGNDSYGIQTVEFGATGHTVEINDGSITTAGNNRTYAVYLEMDNKLNITGGTIKSTTGPAVVYFQGGNQGSISGGTIQGKTYGIYILNSANNSLDISGDVVVSGETGSVNAGGNRYKATPAVTIADGYFNGAVAGGVPSDKTDNYAKYDITGGYFTVSPEDSALYNYSLAKEYTPETYTEDIKASEKTVSVKAEIEKDDATYNYMITSLEYALMNIPYEEFYEAEVTGDTEGADAVSSATKTKKRFWNLAAGSYHSDESSDGIEGVVYPVKVTDPKAFLSAVEALGGKAVTDFDELKITVNARGKETVYDLKGSETLFEAPAYSFYVLAEAPENYKEVTVSGDKMSFGSARGDVKTAEAGVVMNLGDSHTDYSLDITAPELTDGVNVNAVVITAGGKKYGFGHITNIWNKIHIGWNATDDNYSDLGGKTVTNIKYYTTNGIISYDTEVKVPEYKEISALFDDGRIMVSGVPEDAENVNVSVYQSSSHGVLTGALTGDEPVELMSDGSAVLSETPEVDKAYIVEVTADNYKFSAPKAVYSAVQKARDDAKDSIAAAEEALKAELPEDTAEELRGAAEELNDLLEKEDSTASEIKQAVKALDQVIKAAKKEVKAIEDKQAQDAKIAELEKAVKDASDSAEETKKEADALKEQNASNEARIAELDKAVKDASDSAQEAKNEADALKTQNASDEAKIAELEKSVASAEAKAEEANKALSEAAGTASSDAETIKSLKSEVETAKSDVKAANKELAALKKAVAKSRTISGLKLTTKSGKITAKWSKTYGATSYQVQYKLKTAKKWSNMKKSITKAKAVSKKLKKGKKYSVRVRAITLIDGKKVYGKWSAVKTIKVK